MNARQRKIAKQKSMKKLIAKMDFAKIEMQIMSQIDLKLCPINFHTVYGKKKGTKMKPKDIDQIRHILKRANKIRGNMLFNDNGTITEGLTKICECVNETLSLLPCETCNGTGRMPESKIIDGKLTSQNCLHRPECDINTVNHECKCTCDGPKPMPCPDCT